MKIFSIDHTEDSEWLLARGHDANIALRDAAGHPQGATWEPVGVDLLSTDDDGRPVARSDAPWLGFHMLGLRLGAADRVEDLLGAHGELLELRCVEAPVGAFNVTTVVDALDRDRSDLVWFRSGRLMKVERFAFHPGVIPADTAFRLPEYLETILLTETVAAGLTELGLAGFDVTEVGEAVPA